MRQVYLHRRRTQNISLLILLCSSSSGVNENKI